MLENKMLNVSSSPHAASGVTTQKIMLDVIIALMPVTIYGVYLFGYRAALIIVLCILSCVISEYLWQKLTHRPIRVSDLSAVVTGLLLALNLPSTVPFWIPVLGGFFAIIIVKQLYGGIGQNFMNPALAARCFLLLSFTRIMTTFPTVDGVSAATPLAAVKAGETVKLLPSFLSNPYGAIGEASAMLLLLGGLYLLVRRVINIRIPLVYVLTVALLMSLFNGRWDINYIGAQVNNGGLLIGAIFMATDYVTSPVTPVGKIVFALLIGLVTSVFRTFGASAEGVSYAILIGNMTVPLIERATMPKHFGAKPWKREGAAK